MFRQKISRGVSSGAANPGRSSKEIGLALKPVVVVEYIEGDAEGNGWRNFTASLLGVPWTNAPKLTKLTCGGKMA